jgi:hypothetical protein
MSVTLTNVSARKRCYFSLWHKHSRSEFYLTYGLGPCGGAVGWGTALQAGMSRVRLPMMSFGIINWYNPFDSTVALGLTRPSTEMSTRSVSLGVEAAGAQGWRPYHHPVPIVSKPESLRLLEPSGAVQACNGIALPYGLVRKLLLI